MTILLICCSLILICSSLVASINVTFSTVNITNLDTFIKSIQTQTPDNIIYDIYLDDSTSTYYLRKTFNFTKIVLSFRFIIFFNIKYFYRSKNETKKQTLFCSECAITMNPGVKITFENLNFNHNQSQAYSNSFIVNRNTSLTFSVNFFF